MTATTDQPDINVNIENKGLDSGSHIFRVLATFLAIGACVSGAWGMAQFGLLEMAATGTTATAAMLSQLLLRNGFIVLPETESDDARIEEGKGALKAIGGMFQAMLDRSSILRLTIIAIAYGAGFVLFRTLIVWAFTIISNIWLAMMFGGLIAAFIVFPTLFAGIVRALKAKRGR